MKKAILIATALVCASLLAVGSAAAQSPQPQRMHDSNYRDREVAVPVAGFSPNFADWQPRTGPELGATLREDANRLIRWQGWLDVDAFSTSIINQMQYQLENGELELGKFTMAEPSIADAVAEARKRDPDHFTINENIRLGADGETLHNPKFYVWLYRHNVADTGLYQLYISVTGNLPVGHTSQTGDPIVVPEPHLDIQSLSYEFSPNGSRVDGDGRTRLFPYVPLVEIWRGAVVRLNAKGEVTFVGNEAGAVVAEKDRPIESVPVKLWERAPSLVGNPHYDPKSATGAGFVDPLDRTTQVDTTDQGGRLSPSHQQRAGSVQREQRVNTVNPFQFRRHPRQ